MRNPCATCKIHLQGRNKKKEQDCIFCKPRFVYADKYGPPGVGSVPVHLTTYAPRPQTKSDRPALERRNPVPESPKTKTCADPNCPTPVQPRGNFGNNVKAHDGKLKVCKTCRARNRRMKAAAEASAGGTPAPKKPAVQTPNDNVLKIDFTRCPDVLQEIREVADNQERDPDRQILFWLKNGHIDQLRIPMAG